MFNRRQRWHSFTSSLLFHCVVAHSSMQRDCNLHGAVLSLSPSLSLSLPLSHSLSLSPSLPLSLPLSLSLTLSPTLSLSLPLPLSLSPSLSPSLSLSLLSRWMLIISNGDDV